MARTKENKPLVLPLRIDEGLSRYSSGTHYFLVDADENNLAQTQNPYKVHLWRQLCALTVQIFNGESLAVEQVTRIVGVSLVNPDPMSETT